MKKKNLNLFLIMLCLLSLFTLVGCKKDKDLVEEFPTVVANLESYKVKGTLESTFPSGTKVSNITVYYKKPDLYRVELVLPNSLEKQVILKNTDGVHVLIPSLNKNFKVSSNWPLTSSYPYLLSSLSKDILADDDLKKEVTEDTTTYTVDANLFNDAAKTYQKIIFNNKTGLPTQVEIYKNDDTQITKFIFESIETDIELEDRLFENSTTMETLKEVIDESGLEFDRAMSYPTYCPVGVTLKDEITTGSGDTKRVLLTYSGNAFITIIEKFITPYETLKTEYVEGDLYVMGGIATIINESTIRFYEAGIEYMLASSNLDKLELITVGDSLRNTTEK